MKLSLFAILFLISCGSSNEEFTFFQLENQAFEHIVNQSALEAKDDQAAITLSNEEYPVHVSLYLNNRFYYDLPSLGDGEGTWKIEEGKIVLEAKRTLFDMYIEVKSIDCYAEELTLSFIDRFGPQVIRVRKVGAPEQKVNFCIE